MGSFLLKRSGVMFLTALCLTFIVFFLTNLDPNLEKLTKSEGNQRMTDQQVEDWLVKNGYRQNLFKRYGEWLGVAPGWTRTDADTGKVTGRCLKGGIAPEEASSFCGLLQGNWGHSLVFKEPIGGIIIKKLGLTGWLMFWVMVAMVPMALLIGVVAGMREGTKTDRTLSTFSIITTSTPEYVSGVILIVIFASRLGGLRWFKGTSASAMDSITFENFFLPVVALALYGMGYIARMTRASMAEVMTEQYIRTARLKGLTFRAVVLKHALRNALIAPFTVIMLQIPWLLTGVVIIETLFNYKGFGWTLVAAVGNNDIELMMAASVVAVLVVLVTQLISDIGYVFLNPRIRVSWREIMERLGGFEIFGQVMWNFAPVWIGLIVILWASIHFRSRLGLYGKLFDSPIGIAGLILVLFWVLTAIFADQIATFDALDQISGMKNKKPGWPVKDQEGLFYILGGDNLARDVFSRMVYGSREVLIIAPAATLFAFMVGITLGLPAGFYGGRMDTILSFVANLVLAFPVILLFFLLVTPEIRADGPEFELWGGQKWIASVPNLMALCLFLFPIIFFVVLWVSRYSTQPRKLAIYLAVTMVIGLWAYLGLVFNADPFGVFYMDPNLLNIFVSVVFVNSPTVYRIVRGVTIDIKTRDYVAAAQTRGERPWYIMLWEVLPNARGPLIVDFCLRIGYTTILLGTLGFFGLGVSPESPNWGQTINEGRKLLSLYPHLALPPALALMSLVLGLNLLADGLREESLKD